MDYKNKLDRFELLGLSFQNFDAKYLENLSIDFKTNQIF